jgi:hypothetical protein
MSRNLWTLAALVILAPGLRAGEVVEIDGLKSKAPDSWKKAAPANAMQYAVFNLPKADGDADDASLIIYFFGPGQGGTPEANVKRWKDQFKAPAGEKAKVEKFKVGDVETTVVDVAGTWLFRPRPGDPNVTEKPDHRLIGVVFASPKGPYFFRLVGPAKTVEKHHGDFMGWVKNFK